MNASQKRISANPFFSSLLFEESASLGQKAGIHYLSKGDELDLLGEKSVYFLDSGIMESVSTGGKGESNFFNPGSFFGYLPFSDAEPRGELRALSDVKLISLNNDDCINLFSLSPKAMRGYIKAMKLLKYPLVKSAE
ncbi:MAG TPA: cyclic nucleotide-binding domain-containing protein, partial [Spirochaetota bacterium]|nr:cyclic nucleotide-binding domain-containing protein [Spirochaetota bacterium]